MKDFQKKAYFKPREIPERVWKEIVVRAQNSPVSEIKKAQVPDQDLDLRFASLRQPVLMLWGQNDQVIPLSIGQEMRSLHPSTIWREVPECGHLPQKECPLPVIQAIIDMITFGAA
jgi:pimeloyl-ACP methyl ester carboxylesterase